MDWAAIASPFDDGTAYGAEWSEALGLFVVVGFGGSVIDTIITSPDGTAWTGRGDPFGTRGTAVVWATTLNKFVAVGYGATMVATSPDGDTWTGHGAPFGIGRPLAIAWSEALGLLVVAVISDDTSAIWTSPDGVAWTAATTPFDGGGYATGVAWSPSLALFVAAGYDTGSPESVITSPDGVAWTLRSSPFDGNGGNASSVSWAPTRAGFFICQNFVTGSGTPGVIASTDGLSWTAEATPFENLDPSAGASTFTVFERAAALFLGGYHPGPPDTFEICRNDSGATWVRDDEPDPFAGGACNGFAYGGSIDVFIAVGGQGVSGPCIFIGTPVAPPAPPLVRPTPNGLMNTWRWVVCDLASEQKAFLDRLATGVGIDFILDESMVVTFDLPSDDPDVYELTSQTEKNPFAGPRVDYGHRLLFGLRREAPPGEDPWVCRWSGIITITQDQATADEPITHLTAHDPWTWAKSLPVLNPDGSLLGQNGLTYTGKTGAYIAKDLIANAYAWIVAEFADPMPWNHQPNDGQHLPIDVVSGHFDTTEVIDSINFPQGISVGDAWKQLCDTGTVDIILEPVYGANPGVCSILNVYSQAGSQKHSAVFGWDMFPRNLTAVDDLRDGTQIENVVQFWGGNIAAPVQPSDYKTSDSVKKFGPYYASKSYTGAGAAAPSASALSLLALAEVALRKQGKRTLMVDATPELAPDPFTEYYLGDQVPIWAGRDLAPSGNALRGGVDSAGDTIPWRVYGFHIDLADDQQETVTQILLTDPNEGV